MLSSSFVLPPAVASKICPTFVPIFVWHPSSSSHSPPYLLFNDCFLTLLDFFFFLLLFHFLRLFLLFNLIIFLLLLLPFHNNLIGPRPADSRQARRDFVMFRSYLIPNLIEHILALHAVMIGVNRSVLILDANEHRIQFHNGLAKHGRFHIIIIKCEQFIRVRYATAYIPIIHGKGNDTLQLNVRQLIIGKSQLLKACPRD